MKTLPLLLLSALVAFVLLPIRFEIAMSLLVSVGLASLLVADYAKRPRRIRFHLMPVTAVSASRAAALRLAA